MCWKIGTTKATFDKLQHNKTNIQYVTISSQHRNYNDDNLSETTGPQIVYYAAYHVLHVMNGWPHGV